ncbi:MAG TPA: glycosyltransferase family 4 protein [Allosphingosinicella sp.]
MTAPLFRVLITADAVGGVWQYSLDLALGLTQLGIQPIVAVLGPSPDESQREAAADIEGLKLIDTGLPLDWLSMDASATVRAGEAVAALAEEEGVDLVQLNMPALAAGALFRQPVVAVQHSCVASWWEAVKGSDLPQDFAWRTDLVRAGLKAASTVVTPSSAFAAVTQRLYNLPATPSTVYNGRTRLTVLEGASHDFAFTAGRLWDEGKNLRTLDQAAARLGIPVHAAGPIEGPNGAKVTLDHVHALGTIPDQEIGRWLSARPVFVSAALYEPFGLAVLEAASAGCPLILSDIPTFRELWDGVATFIPAHDAQAFALAIEDVVGDAFTREAMGKAAQERAARFTPDAMAAQMAAVYRRLLPIQAKPVLAARAAA